MWCVSLPRRRTVLQSLTVWNRPWRSMHTWAMRPVLQFCPCLFVTCVMYALVYVMAMEVFVRPTVLLVAVFDRCHLFGGCESVSLWYPEQWLINAIKYNNEALVYHGNITGLNLVTRKKQPQFPGWVTPTGWRIRHNIDATPQSKTKFPFISKIFKIVREISS